MDNTRIFADLHLHSSASDGLLTPSELVGAVHRFGLGAMSLTDHDTTAGLAEARRSAELHGLVMIPGIELSTVMGKMEAHFLGYNFDVSNDDLQRELLLFRSARKKRLSSMIDKLAHMSIVISRERVHELAGSGALGRPHLARALVEAGYAGDVSDAFDNYLGRGRPAYVERYKLTPVRAVELIRKAGGLAVMAHPGLANMDDYIAVLVKAGLQGLEVFHPGHTPEQAEQYLDTAGRYNLVVTGGSDWHGDAGAYGPESDRWGLNRKRFDALAEILGQRRYIV